MPTRSPTDIIQQVEEVCRALKARGDGLSWEWDGGFSAARLDVRLDSHASYSSIQRI